MGVDRVFCGDPEYRPIRGSLRCVANGEAVRCFRRDDEFVGRRIGGLTAWTGEALAAGVTVGPPDDGNLKRDAKPEGP